MGLGECPCQRAGGGGSCCHCGGLGVGRALWEFVWGVGGEEVPMGIHWRGGVTLYLWFGKMPLWELGGQGVCGHVLRSHCLQGNWGGWGGLIVPPSG